MTALLNATTGTNSADGAAAVESSSGPVVPVVAERPAGRMASVQFGERWRTEVPALTRSPADLGPNPSPWTTLRLEIPISVDDAAALLASKPTITLDAQDVAQSIVRSVLCGGLFGIEAARHALADWEATPLSPGDAGFLRLCHGMAEYAVTETAGGAR